MGARILSGRRRTKMVARAFFSVAALACPPAFGKTKCLSPCCQVKAKLLWQSSVKEYRDAALESMRIERPVLVNSRRRQDDALSISASAGAGPRASFTAEASGRDQAQGRHCEQDHESNYHTSPPPRASPIRRGKRRTRIFRIRLCEASESARQLGDLPRTRPLASYSPCPNAGPRVRPLAPLCRRGPGPRPCRRALVLRMYRQFFQQRYKPVELL